MPKSGPRTVKRIPDYFTMAEAEALILATDSADTRLVMRLMLRCGLRVSEALSLRPSDLRLDLDWPVVSIRADVPGNKAKEGREVPIPPDLIEFLRDRKSGKVGAFNLPLFNFTRQAVGQGMKRAAKRAGVDLERAHPHTLRHTYGRECALKGVPVTVVQLWLGHKTLGQTMQYVWLAGADHSWVQRIA